LAHFFERLHTFDNVDPSIDWNNIAALVGLQLLCKGIDFHGLADQYVWFLMHSYTSIWVEVTF